MAAVSTYMATEHNHHNDQRFLGEPNTKEEHWVKTQKGEYRVKVEYGNDGRAIGKWHWSN